MQLPVLKNTDGKPSATFTMMVVGFTVVTLWLLLSIVEKIGGFQIRQFSGSESMLYLTPLLATYYGRRQQDLKTLPVDQEPKKEE
jgi:hypothetical protein